MAIQQKVYIDGFEDYCLNADVPPDFTRLVGYVFAL
jgi:hypothetical protein